MEEGSPIGMIVAGSERALRAGEFVQNGDPSPVLLVKTESLLREGVSPVRNLGCNCSIEVLLSEGYSTRSVAVTLELIKKGRPTPTMANMVATWKMVKRVFKTQYYEKVDWLTGCEATVKLYCWPCLLFDTVRTNNLWSGLGFDDMYNFYKSFKRHENTPNHIHATMQYESFVVNHLGGAQPKPDPASAARVTANRKILGALTAALVPFVGAQDALPDAETLFRLAGYPYSSLYLEKNLVPDLVSALSKTVSDTVTKEIAEAPFVSLYLDQLPSKKFSVVFRYVSGTAEIVDRFLGFHEGEDDVTKLIRNITSKYKLHNKVAYVCLGRIRQTEVVQHCGKIHLFHSPVHRLSHVLPAALEHIKECVTFFRTVQGLQAWVGKMEEDLKMRIPFVSQARWKDRLVETAQEHKGCIVDAIQSVLDNPAGFDGETYTLSLGLQNAFRDLEFLFLLAVFGELFPVTDSLLDMVLNNSKDTKYCVDTVVDYIKVLNWKKEKFEELWDSVQETGAEETSKKRRHATASRLVAYYRSLYDSAVDTVVAQVKLRFGDLSGLEYATLLDISEEHKAVEDRLVAAMTMSRWDNVFDAARLKSELSVAYCQVDFQGKSVEGLLRLLYESRLSKSLHQVTKLCRLLAVMPYASKGHGESFHSSLLSFSKTNKSLFPTNLVLHAKYVDSLSKSEQFINDVIDNFSEINSNIDLKHYKPISL